MNAASSIDDPRLATRLGSLALVNPIICGSGEHVMTASGIRAALQAGVAGVVAKSINESADAARQLNGADYAQLAPDGTLREWQVPGDPAPLRNSVFCRSGLAGYPPGEWFPMIAALDREAAAASRFVAASIVLAGDEAASDLATLAADSGVRILELNIGAPHGAEAQAGAITVHSEPRRVATTVAGVRRRFPGQLWVKLPGTGDNLVALAEAARAAGADAVVLAGRVMGMMPDVDTLRPVLGTAAAYGGQWAVPITCRWLALTRRALGSGFPLIGTNGARCGLDVARFLLAGAAAVEMTSVVWLAGFDALSQSRQELLGWLQHKDLTVSAVVGRAADELESYAEQPQHAGRWRSLVPPESNA